MDDSAQNLDRDKFEFEKQKFAFTLQQYEAESANRKLASDKLRLETELLARPWYRTPASLGPFATVLVALVGGFIAFGTDVFKSNLAGLHRDYAALQTERDTLTTGNQTLRSQQAHLVAGTNDLQIRNATLAHEEDGLKTQMTRLTAQKMGLVREVAVAPFKTHLSIFTSRKIFDPVDPADPTLVAMLKEVHDKKGDPEFVALLTAALQKYSLPMMTTSRPLELALYEATGLDSWKQQLRTHALADVEEAAHHPGDNFALDIGFSLWVLKQDDLFPLPDRVQSLKTMYAKVVSIRRDEATWPSVGYLLNPTAILAHWDPKATVIFRDPWFQELRILYRIHPFQPEIIFMPPMRDNSYANISFYSYSPQAFDIFKLKDFANYYPNLPPQYSFATLTPSSFPCPAPADFPLCARWNTKDSTAQPALKPQSGSWVLSTSDIPAYRSWLTQNAALVEAWSDPSFTVLRHCPDATMAKIVAGQWVTLDELTKASPQ